MSIEREAIRASPCQSGLQHLGTKTRIGNTARERNKLGHKSARKDSKLTLARISSESQRGGKATPPTHAKTVLTRTLREQFGEVRQHAACADRITGQVAD